MPWQLLVAEVGCEYREDKRGRLIPYYNEIIVTVPRQSGKTTLFLSWQIDRCLNWGSVQRSAFTAQTGKDARDKWIDELFPLVESSELKAFIGRHGVNRGMGNEALKFRNGSLIRILSTSTSSGHSKTLDQAVMDEVWHDVDDRREQGLRPAMITRSDRQLLVCSTAGTAASTVYNRKRQIGRAAALADIGHGIAYFEWSAPDEWDLADQDSWWEFMPALGHTITPDSIEAERLAMPEGEFKRAYGNIPTAGADAIIPPELWDRVNSENAKPEGALSFGLDVSEDRSSASIVARGANGVLELIENRIGDLEWVVPRTNQLTQDHNARVTVDGTGPASSFKGLHRCDVLKGPDVLRGCAALFDAIIENRIVFRRDSAMDAAVVGAVKRYSGDLWAWSRRAAASDVSPLMAATLAMTGRRKPRIHSLQGSRTT
jgi:phage terminase large subunit-like protein